MPSRRPLRAHPSATDAGVRTLRVPIDPPLPVPQPAGHEWTLRWMDGSAVSCGTIFDAELSRWRLWVVCNRVISVGGPTFATEHAASDCARSLRDDWALDLSGRALAAYPLLPGWWRPLPTPPHEVPPSEP